jgi:hypothetical protein
VTHPDIANVPSSAAIASAAADFDKLAPAVDDVMNTVKGAWSRLSVADVFQTPDSDQVFGALSSPTTISSTIGQDAAAVKKALNDYVSALADLERRRNALAEEQAVVDLELLADPVPAPGSTGTYAGDGGQSEPLKQRLDLDARVTLFNKAVDQADEDCAVALVGLIRDPMTGVMNAVQQVGVVMDDPRVMFGQESVGKGLYAASEVRPTFQAIMDARASGQALFRYSPPDMKQLGRDLLGVIKIGGGAEHATVGLLDRAGGSLGLAGAVTTAGVTFADQWQKDEARHSDWNWGTRTIHATEHGAAVAVGSVVGADIGSGVGQAVGIAAGEAIFPLGGGLIGGFIGGVIGGAVGGKIGEMTAGGLTDFVDDVANW